jgi:hypothetical protein
MCNEPTSSSYAPNRSAKKKYLYDTFGSFLSSILRLRATLTDTDRWDRSEGHKYTTTKDLIRSGFSRYLNSLGLFEKIHARLMDGPHDIARTGLATFSFLLLLLLLFSCERRIFECLSTTSGFDGFWLDTYIWVCVHLCVCLSVCMSF